jgi:hypothetical protein
MRREFVLQSGMNLRRLAWWLRLLGSGALMVALALPAAAQLPDGAGVVVVDGEHYPRTDAGIAAAIASLHGPGQVVLPVGVYEIAKEIVIDVPGISIVGMGYGSRLSASSPTENVFRVTSPLFQLANVEIQSGIEHMAGSVVKIESDQGSVHHVRLSGSFYNGFTLDSQRAGGWSFDEIRLVGGTSWNAGWVLSSETATIASTHLHNVFISNAVHWKSASIVLDTGVDTFICSDAELGPVLVRNSLRGQAPRWIRFTNSFIEAGYAGKVGGTGLQIDAARDLRYQGYFATSQVGVVVGAGARGVQLSESEFVNIGRSAVTVAGGAADVSIVHNTFEDTGVEADGQFDTVSAAEDIASLDVSYNTFKSVQSKRPRYNLALPVRCSACIADGNRYGGFRTSAVFNQEGPSK